MKKAAAHPTTKSPSDSAQFALGTVALDFLDTTWRIAVPVVLFAALGIVADKRFGTKPWLTILATIVGFMGAGLLVKRQLAAVSKEDKE